MDQDDGFVACPEANKETIERYVLVLFYFATQGDEWGSCSTGDLSCSKRWLSDEHHCNWDGVSCNKAKYVTKIVMKNNGLKGPLPSEVSALSALARLSLDHNQINGTISSSIGNLDQLQILELDDNLMTGTLPQSLYLMSALKAIDLNDNRFVGGISSDIANLTELMVLQLENNNFTDPLPVAELSQLEKLSEYIVRSSERLYPNTLILTCLLFFSSFLNARQPARRIFRGYLPAVDHTKRGQSYILATLCNELLGHFLFLLLRVLLSSLLQDMIQSKYN